MDASQVDISFEQNVLTIRGTKRSTLEASNDGELRVYAAERVTGSFERSIRLPEFVRDQRGYLYFLALGNQLRSRGLLDSTPAS